MAEAVPTHPESTTATPEPLAADNAALRAQLAALTRQLEWFKRQLFGPTSERRAVDASATADLLAEAPANVLEGSLADVSLLAGLVVDKCCYRLPLYRQHQRLADASIRVSRATLTNLIALTPRVWKECFAQDPLISDAEHHGG